MRERDLLNGKDAGSGGETERARRSWEKKLSLVNLITLVTVRPGQTQQPNTLHLKHKQCELHTHKHTHTGTVTYVRPQISNSDSIIQSVSSNLSCSDQNKDIKLRVSHEER